MLVLLFSGLVACSGVFGSPLTDDVATLDTLVRRIACSHLSLLVFFFFHVYLGYTVRKWTLNCTSPYCWGGTFLYLVYLLPGKVHKIYPLKLYSKNCDFKGTLYLLYFLVKYNILKPHKH